MKIAFTSKGPDWNSPMDPRFGRTDFILIFNKDSGEITADDNKDIRDSAHGAGPLASKKLIELGPDILITGNGPGSNASAVLEKSGIKIFIGAQNMTVKEAYEAWEKGLLASL